jgi:integrase/recombinase XerD
MDHSSLSFFERHLKARGLQPTTVERYGAIIARLLAHAACAPDAVTSDLAYAFLVDEAHRVGQGASGYNVAFTAVVRWFECCDRALHLRGLQPQRRKQEPPRWLTTDTVHRLFAALDDRRYRMASQVALATGLRVRELLALRVTDLDQERPLIHVARGKGGDGRLVQFPATLRDRLRDYWRVFRPRDYLFERRPCYDQRAMLAQTLASALAHAARRAGLPAITPHQLRHTYAVHSLRAGMDIRQLQALLGHRRLASTLRYLTPDIARCDAAVIDLLERLEVAP